MPRGNTTCLFDHTYHCLQLAVVDDKLAAVEQLDHDWLSGKLSRQNQLPAQRVEVPGRPQHPQLVSPKELTRRGLGTKEGHAALIHSLCHIEFNAINLALDAVYRFRDMPESYYNDWLKVAREEAYHFDLLRRHLSSLGYTYGDFVAHNGLWQAALDTDHDPLIRMALVPRVLEARGLDVTPGIMRRLQGMGDQRAVEILEIIHRDEIGHVAIGSRWFNYLCKQRDLPAETTFAELFEKYMHGGVRKPIAHISRRQAGFTEAELAYLEQAG